MPITTTTASTRAFIVEEGSIHIDQGHQIDWATVGAGYIDAASGKKIIPAGKAMTYLSGVGSPAASDMDTPLPIVPTTGPAHTGAVFFLATDAIEDDPSAALSGYGVIIGGTLFENLMPDNDGENLPALLKAELELTRVDGYNRGFAYRKAYDSRAV